MKKVIVSLFFFSLFGCSLAQTSAKIQLLAAGILQHAENVTLIS